jgi:hypothetical protein
MPKISWLKLPLPVRQHLIDRMHDWNITKEDIAQLMIWIATNPEVPDGPWFKDFRSLKLCGQGNLPKTFLAPDQSATGTEL